MQQQQKRTCFVSRNCDSTANCPQRRRRVTRTNPYHTIITFARAAESRRGVSSASSPFSSAFFSFSTLSVYLLNKYARMCFSCFIFKDRPVVPLRRHFNPCAMCRTLQQQLSQTSERPAHTGPVHFFPVDMRQHAYVQKTT